MTDYRKLYLTLFNGITDAIELIDALDILRAKELLISLQQKTEDMFIDDEDWPRIIHKSHILMSYWLLYISKKSYIL